MTTRGTTLLVLLTLVSGFAAASGSPAVPVPRDADGPLLLRFAVLATAPGKPSEPPTGGSTADVTRALLGWDLESDRAEVGRIFGLHRVDEIARQAAELPSGGGRLRGTYAVGERHYRVQVEVGLAPGHDVVSLHAEVARDGDVL